MACAWIVGNNDGAVDIRLIERFDVPEDRYKRVLPTQHISTSHASIYCVHGTSGERAF